MSFEGVIVPLQKVSVNDCGIPDSGFVYLFNCLVPLKKQKKEMSYRGLHTLKARCNAVSWYFCRRLSYKINAFVKIKKLDLSHN